MDTNRLDVRSLVGLFYMLLLAMALAMAIAGIERFFAAHPKLWQRLRRPFTPVAVAGAVHGLLHESVLASAVMIPPAAPCCSMTACFWPVTPWKEVKERAGRFCTGQRLASRASNIIPEDMRRVPDHGFSKSALEISRSFRPRGRR